MRALVTVVSLCFLSVQAQWTYSGDDGLGENEWSTEYPACGGQRQSPINLKKKEVKFNPSLGQLYLDNYGAEELEFPMTNNGHTVQITLPNTMYFTDSNGDVYIAEQMHFHWGGGSSGVSGSEHTIDGIRRAIEIHAVHFNSKYGSFDNAKNQPDGLAVLAALVEIDKYAENTYYSSFLDELSNIEFSGESTILHDTNIQNLLPEDTANYYTYEGSLTTPPCTENVRWFLFRDTVKLSETQVVKFENSIRNHHNETLHDGYRKTQPLGQRVVEANFPNSPENNYKKILYLKKIDEKLTYLTHYVGPRRDKRRRHN